MCGQEVRGRGARTVGGCSSSGGSRRTQRRAAAGCPPCSAASAHQRPPTPQARKRPCGSAAAHLVALRVRELRLLLLHVGQVHRLARAPRLLHLRGAARAMVQWVRSGWRQQGSRRGKRRQQQGSRRGGLQLAATHAAALLPAPARASMRRPALPPTQRQHSAAPPPTVLLVMKFLSLDRTKAAPLPGLTCRNSAGRAWNGASCGAGGPLRGAGGAGIGNDSSGGGSSNGNVLFAFPHNAPQSTYSSSSSSSSTQVVAAQLRLLRLWTHPRPCRARRQTRWSCRS